jgi:hypothetical protein
MLLKDYDCKGSGEKKKNSGHESQEAWRQDELISGKQLNIIHHPNFYMKQCFRGSTLSPFSGKKPTQLDQIDRVRPYLRVLKQEVLRRSNPLI